MSASERVGSEGCFSRRQRDKRRRVADILVDMLFEAGVEVVFGIPGAAISPIFDALHDRPEIRVIVHKHENSALFAASGYARASGTLAVALVTSGPGVLNAMTGIATAYCEGLPVLVFAGEVARTAQGKGVIQDGSSYRLGLVEMVKHISKLSTEVPSASSAPALLARAMATALSGSQGPVFLSLPMDVALSEIAQGRVATHVQTSFELPPQGLETAAIMLRAAKRPVILAGNGVRGGKGPESLLAFAEHLQWPVMTTMKGKGVFPEDHHLALGVIGTAGHPSAHAYVQEGVDTLLAIGTSLNEHATTNWDQDLFPARNMIHVDIEISRTARGYAPDLVVTAPAEIFLNAMRSRLPGEAKRAVFGVKRLLGPDESTVGERGLIAPHRALWEAQQRLPEDTIWVVDCGLHQLFAGHYLCINHPDAFITMTGLGSMGSSIGAAIGAKLASPERTVAVVIGDGGLAMVGNDLATATQYGISLVVLVINDQRLGMVEAGCGVQYRRAFSFPLPTIDPAALGQSVGGRAHRVTAPPQILELQGLAPQEGHTTVLDIRVDPTVPIVGRRGLPTGHCGPRKPQGGRLAAPMQHNARSCQPRRKAK